MKTKPRHSVSVIFQLFRPLRRVVRKGAGVLLTLLILSPAIALADEASQDKWASPSSYSENFGEFRIYRSDSMLFRFGIEYRGQPYRPLNAWEITDVRATGATRGGQPVLMATTIDYWGVGTVVIAVQNDVPLARIVSPLKEREDPDWGVPQADRQSLLLFPMGARAFDSKTGDVLWFDDRIAGEWRQPFGVLASVAPDNRSAALLVSDGFRISAADTGVYAVLPISKDVLSRHLAPGRAEVDAEAKAAVKAGKRYNQRRQYREAEVAWVGKNFRWQQTPGGWQFKGLGLTSTPLKSEQ